MARIQRGVSTAVAAAAATAMALSCGGSSSTPPSTLPTPTSTPPVIRGLCSALSGDFDADCDRTSSQLVDSVLAAMDKLVEQKPQIFDKNDQGPGGPGSFRVLDKEAYLDGVVANLQAAGLCAQRDPDDCNYEQLQVKKGNDFSENFDVLTGTGFMWRNWNSYRITCNPASFPIDRTKFDVPPLGSGCCQPYPPPISLWRYKIHLPGNDYDVLDSTALVADPNYCAAIGYPGTTWNCPVRREGSPDRFACEAWRVGKAKDTGRPGPTWTLDGHYCTGPASGCANHPENQYDLYAYASGTYRMCAANGACGELVVHR